MRSFLFGVLAGALVVTYWYREIAEFEARHLPRMRKQGSDTDRAMEAGAGLRNSQTRQDDRTSANELIPIRDF